MCIRDRVKIADAVIAELHRQSEGRMRLVMNGVAAIERLAVTNGLSEVRGEHVKDIPLCHDWQGRRSRVPGRVA